MPLSRFVVYFCSLMTVCVVGATRLTPPADSAPVQEQPLGSRTGGNGVITYEDAIFSHTFHKTWAAHVSAKETRPAPSVTS